MRSFKKKTIALVLASVVTVVGSFAGENYKNSLMGLNFKNLKNGNIHMSVETKTPYNGNVKPVKKDANTYVLMLPETNSLASTPNLESVGGYIESVNIRTMPYSNNTSGYTRVTIKVAKYFPDIEAENTLYISSGDKNQALTDDVNKRNSMNYSQISNEVENDSSESNSVKKMSESISPREEDVSDNTVEQVDEENVTTAETTIDTSVDAVTEPNDDYNAYLLLLAVLVVLSSIYLYLRAKEKMKDLAGSGYNFEYDDNQETIKEKTVKKIKKIKNTIKTLDNTYKASAKIENKKPQRTNGVVIKTSKPNINNNDKIIDIDDLFNKQQVGYSEEENEALERFLSGFSFDESIYNDNLSEYKEASVDYTLFDEIISNGALSFTDSDLEQISKLLSVELNEDALNYAVSKKVSKPIQNKNKVLEDLLLSYSIKQDISFSSDDVEIIKKIMNVELEEDFVTNLKINKARNKELEEEILKTFKENKKPSEVVTLHVKDMLPNLSEALKKNAGKTIRSNYKSKIVYYGEECEVSVLPVKDLLPDLSMELIQKTINTQKKEITKKTKEKRKTETHNKIEIPVLKNNVNEVQPKKEVVMEEPQAHKKEEMIKDCVFGEEMYSVISVTKFTDNTGCYLAKNEKGYVVLAFVGEKLSRIKYYEKLNSERIQSRKSEALDDINSRYIVRIGTNKFLVNANAEKIEYVMDLC